MNTIVDNLVQCIGCGVFDRLFQIVSAVGAAVYQKITELTVVMLVMFWIFFAVWVFWLFLKSKGENFSYQKELKSTLIATIIVSGLLSFGVMFPRFISIVTFEPVADITAVYSQMVLQISPEEVSEKVTYVPMPMSDEGIFRPELRDKVIHLMATVVTQFQGMIKLGLAVVVNSFHLTLDPVQLLRQILMFVMGVYLVYIFFKLFIKFCFYFLDVIIELAMFAFLFPFALAAFVLKSSNSTEWVKELGAGFAGGKRFQNVVNAIVNLAANVLVYLIIMVVIAKFFQSSAMESNELVAKALSGTIRYGDLSDENMVNMTLMSFIILGYLVDYMAKQVGDVGKAIFGAFNVNPPGKGSEGEKLAEAVMKSAKGGVVDPMAKKIGDTIKAAKGGSP